MAVVREEVVKTGNSCDECQTATKLYYVIEWRGLKIELCLSCAENLRRQLGQVLHAGRAPRRKKQQSRTGGTRESWEDVT